jgi:hypothetical protein
MAWRYGRWSVDHELPLGATDRLAVGRRTRAGDILARGIVVGPAHRVAVARRAGLRPEELEAVPAARVGAEVTRGAALAGPRRPFARAATSPVDGLIVHGSRDGDRYVAPVVERWTARSTMDGTVVRSDEAVVTVEGSAWALEGLAAYGPDAVGELALAVDAPMDELSPARLDVGLRDRILIGGARMSAEAIARAHACGVAATVAGAAPAAGLRVVYGEDCGAWGLPLREDRPTVLCLIGFGAATLPREIFLPLIGFAESRAAVHAASARLFVFAPPDAHEPHPEPPTLVLAADHAAVRPLEEPTEFVGVTRFPSELEADAIATAVGTVPAANVLPYGARR